MIYDYFDCPECGYPRVSDSWAWQCPRCGDEGPYLTREEVYAESNRPRGARLPRQGATVAITTRPDSFEPPLPQREP